MRQCQFYSVGLVLALAVAAGCSSTAPGPSMTMASGNLLAPANGTTFKFKDQPVTLTTSNGVSTGGGPVTYVFEVASDSGFATKVYTSAKVPQGSAGQTSLTLDKVLDGGKTYYWRAQTFDGGTAGPYGAALSFVVKPPVTITAPVLVSPADNETVGSLPHFVVTNSVATNAVGKISYNYQISRNTAFTDKVESGFAVEQPGQTAWDGKTDLGSGNTYYWRVWTTDSDGNASGYSTTLSFKTMSFDAKQAIFLNNPGDLGSWAETAKITRIDFSSGNVVVDFDKRMSPDRWPDVPFGSGNIQYTLGMCLQINKQWYCSAAIQFWNGRDLEAGGNMNEIGINWYYDGRWGIMSGYQPRIGELVGIFVAAGNLRDSLNWKIEERSNIAMIPYGTNYSR
jgi:hypothetical protein